METATVGAANRRRSWVQTVADLLPLAAAQARRARRRPLQGARLLGVDLEDVRRGRGDRRAALARADGARGREGRQGRDPLQHAARVVLLRLRGAVGGRHRGPDLPDQLPGRVPVRARELRRQGGDRRGLRAAGEDPGDPRRLPEARARRLDDRLERGHDLDRRADRARRGARRRRVGGPLELGDDGRHLHVHLHVRHDRAAEGMRDLARQLPRDDRHGALPERARGRSGSPTSTCRWPTRSPS